MQSSKNCTGNMQNAAIITQFKAIAKLLNARGRMKVAMSHQTLNQAAKRSAGVLEHPGYFTVSTTSHSHTTTLFEHQKVHSKALVRSTVHTNGTGKHPALHTGQSWLCSYPSGLTRKSRRMPYKTHTGQNNYSTEVILTSPVT